MNIIGFGIHHNAYIIIKWNFDKEVKEWGGGLQKPHFTLFLKFSQELSIIAGNPVCAASFYNMVYRSGKMVWKKMQ